jgi:hypothetical protein
MDKSPRRAGPIAVAEPTGLDCQMLGGKVKRRQHQPTKTSPLAHCVRATSRREASTDGCYIILVMAGVVSA